MKFLLLLVIMLFNSCASYISKMHRQFDNYEDRRVARQRPKEDALDFYSKKNYAKKTTTGARRFISPQVRRYYRPNSHVKKRYRASDLDDSGPSNSLWVDPSRSQNSLFTKKVDKISGDIILIHVQGKLKNEITSELKRVYSIKPKPKITLVQADGGKKGAAKGAKAKQEKVAAPNPTVDVGNVENGDKIYDIISSVVVDEVSRGHLLLRGRKNILFRNRKRLIEVQALVRRNMIASDDTLKSNKIIESQVQVIR